MAGLGVLAIGILFFVVPPTAFWLRLRALRPRRNSLVHHALRLALHRLVVVAIALLPQVVVVLELFHVNPAEQPVGAHESGPTFALWREDMASTLRFVALLSIASWVVLLVTFVRDMILVVRTARARRRVLVRGEARTPPEGATVALDFGVGDAYWAFYGPGRDGYREARPIESWARGRPTLWPSIVAPIVTIVTAVAAVGLLGIDLILAGPS